MKIYVLVNISPYFEKKYIPKIIKTVAPNTVHSPVLRVHIIAK